MRQASVALTLFAMIAVAGCAHQAAPTKRVTRPAAAVPLPEWAPANPTPEFVRGAQVLKPVPPEVMGAVAASSPEKGVQALVERYKSTWIPAYEFFGTLSDRQVQQFKSTRTVRVPVKSMRRAQRRALDSYFEGWRTAMASDPHFPDLLVMLYKDGAKQDLSNVDAGFVGDGQGVNLQFWITRADGSVSTPSNTVAMM